MTTDGNMPSALGFLTIVEREPHGLFGGLLLLNLAGRPLEFHCTAPLKPNRSQQILYGPTLKPFLFGEHIGAALAMKCEITPLAIFANQAPTLALRGVVDTTPVCLIESPAIADTASAHDAAGRADHIVLFDASHVQHGMHVHVSFGSYRLMVDARWRDDAELLQARLSGVPREFDLLEPFSRIEEAIEESQRAMR